MPSSPARASPIRSTDANATRSTRRMASIHRAASTASAVFPSPPLPTSASHDPGPSLRSIAKTRELRETKQKTRQNWPIRLERTGGSRSSAG